jgi:monoamine oxidase
MKRTEVDVVIVGAGFSGLAAARAIAKAGRSVMVLEARNRVGGRVHSSEVAGKTIELGAEFTGPGQDALKRLGAEFGLELVPCHYGGRTFYYRTGEDGETPREILDQPPYDYGSAAAGVHELDRLAESVPAEAPWAAPSAEEWDRHTAASWMQTHLAESSRPLLEAAHRGMIGQSDQTSFLHSLFYSKANGGYAAIMGIGKTPHDNEMFSGGNQTIASGIAKELAEGVKLNFAVQHVRQDEQGVAVTGPPGRVHAQRIIIAMPPALAGRIMYEPALPPARSHLMMRYASRSKLKAVAVYREPFWRADGNSGMILGNGFVSLDGSTCENFGVLILFLGLRESLRVWNLSKEARRAFAGDRLAMFLGSKARDMLGYDDKHWSDEYYSTGCVFAPSPGMWTTYGPSLREAIGRIHWAGTETSTVMPGQMDGAVRAGERAARDALELLR